MNAVDLFLLQNPWRKTIGFRVSPYLPRTMIDCIAPWLNEPEILVLIGPRQSGKTTLILKIIEGLLAQGKTAEEVLYFSCDDSQIRALFDNVVDFVNFVKQVSKAERRVVFVDEIQRIAEPGLFLKQLYDLKLDLKLIVSGSSSLEIRSQIAEPLTGRKMVFTILPMRSRECLFADETFAGLLSTDLSEIQSSFSDFDKIWGEKLQLKIHEYLVYGGYPRILQTLAPGKKTHLLHEIYSSYVQKDVTDFLKVENVPGFNKLVQLFAISTGQVINKSGLALSAGISVNTLDKYLQILVDTFVICVVSPFFTNKVKEIVKNPKVYFVDPGMRNSVANLFNPVDSRSDAGFLQETFILGELQEMLPNHISVRFWRTKVGAEVDFVIDTPQAPIPIECKSRLKKPIISRGYRNFLKQYQPPRGLVVNTGYYGEQIFEGVPITFVPYRWFSLLGRAAVEKALQTPDTRHPSSLVL